MKHVIVSRHPSAVELIRRELGDFAEAHVLETATAEDVRDASVAGNLPLHLACLASEVFAVEFEGSAPRGQEYTIEDMDAAGAHISRYRVTRLAEPLPDLVRWVYDNQLGSRSRKPACLVVTRQGDILRFDGSDIPGVVKVLNTSYTQSGKWSHTVFSCASPPGITPIKWRQDFENGRFWPQESWEEAMDWVLKKAPQAKGIEAVIRSHWAKAAKVFDENQRALDEFAKL